jgi:hypothetical protein
LCQVGREVEQLELKFLNQLLGDIGDPFIDGERNVFIVETAGVP